MHIFANVRNEVMGMENLRDNRLAAALRAGSTLLGVYNGFPAESVLESMGRGWDFIWIDAQHGQFSLEDAFSSVRTATGMGLESVLRVPTHDVGWLGAFADTAASALMAPQVDTPESAATIVSALRFPPRGKRSFGGRRPVDLHGRKYYLTCEPVLAVQIESREGLENVRRIAAVDGVDMLFFGADDLKVSLGMPIDTPLRESDMLVQARRMVAEAAREAGKWCGLPVGDPQELLAAVQLGFQLISCGSDVRFVRAGSHQALLESRKVIETQTSQFRATEKSIE